MSDGAIPSEVLSEYLQQRLSGKRLLGALFLTFEYDAGFFEQEILPVILDVQVSHAVVPRLLQLEDALRGVRHGVTVFYDQRGLITSDTKAPRLDVRRLPIRLRKGIFHPKHVFLLTEDRADEEGQGGTRRLFVATLSANLTRAGWWSNVEACHVEELEDRRNTRMREPLLLLLRRVRQLSDSPVASSALQPYLAFVSRLVQLPRKRNQGRLAPHLYVGGVPGGDDLSTFLRTHIPADGGYRVELISPFFDKAPASSPLATLRKAIKPSTMRVFLPRDASGAAQCSEAMFAHVRDLDDKVEWGLLPGDLLSGGKRKDAAARHVHAKVYRIFKPHPKTEYLFVGSCNLTAPGHSGQGGNLETGVLVQVDPDRRPDFWLQPLKKDPSKFEPQVAEEDSALEDVLPVQVRYDWKDGAAFVLWQGKGFTQLQLAGTGGALGEPVEITTRDWTSMSEATAAALREELTSTSIVRVQTADEREAMVLVQEEGMELKPELVRSLPVRDILMYWALLKAEQRQAFIERRLDELSPGEASQVMAPLDDGQKVGNDIFEQSAGIFHAFATLERRIDEALADQRPHQAAALVFGERFDSLPTVLARLSAGTRLSTDDSRLSEVERYLILMCAVQLTARLEASAQEFWADNLAHAKRLDDALAGRMQLRENLCASDPAAMPAFMDWFDHWFLKRAEPLKEAQA